MRRAEWMEGHMTEPFLMIAEETPDGWAFFEKSAWEVRWYRIPEDARLRSTAERLAAG